MTEANKEIDEIEVGKNGLSSQVQNNLYHSSLRQGRYLVQLQGGGAKTVEFEKNILLKEM